MSGQALQHACVSKQMSQCKMRGRAYRNSAALHKVDIFHVAALIIDDGFGGKHLLRQHKSQAFYCASWQALELWHLYMGPTRCKHVCIAQPDTLSGCRHYIFLLMSLQGAYRRHTSLMQQLMVHTTQERCSTANVQHRLRICD